MFFNRTAFLKSSIKIRLIILFVILFTLFESKSISALTCYRGQQNASMPVIGPPQECPVGSLSCTKIFEPSMNIAQRDCSLTNCTANNMISTVSICQNSSSYPFNTYCCCYGNNCNSAPALFEALSWRFIASNIFLVFTPFLIAQKVLFI